MITLLRIAEIVNGVVVGDGDYKVKSIHSLEQAGKDSITFFSERKLKQQLQNSNAGAVLIRAEHTGLFPGNKIIVTDPNLAHALISRHFKKHPRRQQTGIAETAIVADDVSIGARVAVGPFSTIGEGVHLGAGVVIGNGVSIGDNVRIGEDTIIEDRVVIAAGCAIGNRCCISPAAIIGASGFGYVPYEGKWEKVEQLGGVTIGDDVDIGACTTIDRGALEDTLIGNGVKLDNHIQIAHNVQVGDHTIMAAFVGISGSVVIGQRCKLGARVGIIGHLKIADDVSIQASSVISKNIEIPGEYSSIIVAQPARQWRKNSAIIRRLDKLMDRVKTLEKKNLKM